MERLDHSMIFVLIAGSATPLFVVATPGPAGIAMASAFAAVTLGLLVAHMLWLDAPEALVGGAYVALGCLGAAALPGVWRHGGVTPFVLVVGGGALYIAGALQYHRRRPDPRPAVFGFHEVFHTYVCVAAALQYIAIAVFIL
jgi:hemolysin III